MTLPTDRPATLLERERLHQGLLAEAEAELVRARIAAHGDPAEGLPSDAEVFGDDPPERFLGNVRAAVAEAEFARFPKRADDGWRPSSRWRPPPWSPCH